MKECSAEGLTPRIKKTQGKVSEMDKFVAFWGGIWENDTITPNRKWMETVAEKVRTKITNVERMTINEEKLYETIKKRKNWSAPEIDAIQIFWCKKLKGTWKSLVKCLIDELINLIVYQIGLPKEEQYFYQKQRILAMEEITGQ